MRKRRVSVFPIVTLLSLGLTASAAMSQTKPNVTGTPKKSPTVAARTVPPIKCTDPDSMVACKSFKQLVDGWDKDLMDSLTGDKESNQGHVAYVCLRPKADVFQVVKFDEPRPDRYRPYSGPGGAKNPEFFLREGEAFPSGGGKPVLALEEAREKWYEDHDDYSLYALGYVSVDSWQSGIMTAFVSDFGKWQRPLPEHDKRSDEDVLFEGAYQWLAHFNQANANKFIAADDREHAHIDMSSTSIYVHYSFKNKSNNYTDYTLNIQRSTGRFTESFESTDTGPFEDSGTCMSFKY
ncbi:MAG: hypothetical protein WA802_08805 [Terracidiphilus sp.]